MPKKSATLLEQIRKAGKNKDWATKDNLEERFRMEIHDKYLLPQEMDATYLRAIKSASPFRKHFETGDTAKFKKGALNKLYKWDAAATRLYDIWFHSTIYWEFSRCIAALGPALARDAHGKLTAAAVKLESLMALVLHLLTFYKGSMAYLKDNNHHPGQILLSLPVTIGRITEEITNSGGLVEWLAKRLHKRTSPYNIYDPLSWVNRKRETVVRKNDRKSWDNTPKGGQKYTNTTACRFIFMLIFEFAPLKAVVAPVVASSPYLHTT